MKNYVNDYRYYYFLNDKRRYEYIVKQAQI
jgi:hypothetical protein